jgi:hypothetical protein
VIFTALLRRPGRAVANQFVNTQCIRVGFNASVFLVFSCIAARTGRRLDEAWSLSFLEGLAERTETVLVHSLWLLLPAVAWQIAAGWAVIVSVSVAGRIVAGYRLLC